MQPVVDPHFLQVAEPRVELDQRLFVFPRAAFLQQAGAFRALQNEVGQHLSAPRIESLRLRIFVKQGFDFRRRAMRARLDQGRRQMADDDRRRAALGLRRLAGIIDDEGIDQRHGAERDFRRAILRQRHALARQPFQRAMRAAVDQRVDVFVFAQPQIEGEKAVARRESAIMIIGLAILQRATIRLQRDKDFSQPQETEHEGAISHGKIAFGIAPGRLYAGAKIRRQAFEKGAIGFERHRRRQGAGLQFLDQIGGRLSRVIAFSHKTRKNRARRFGCVSSPTA